MAKKRKAAAGEKRRKSPGLAPGTLIFTGEKFVDEPHLTLTQYNTAEILEEKRRNTIPDARAGEWVSWYDVRGLHQVEIVESLGKLYDIHPLVLEDILDINQRPKFEEYEGGVFLALQALRTGNDHFEIETEQVTIFAGPSFTLSFQEKEDDLFLPVRERLNAGRGKIRQRGGDYLLYALADSIVDRYFLVMDQLEANIDRLEEEILINPSNQIKARIHELKISAITMRKSVAPLREAINRFSKSDSPVVQETTQIFARDLYDHTIQVMDAIDTYRDLLNGLYDLYLSEISYKMNTVMQTLTIISTIFIPLTFLAGIYGMNFEHMPELHWKYSYFLLWGIMIITTVFLLIVFRRKRWL